MKKFIKNYSTVLIISAALLVLFVLGGFFSRYMTSQIEVHAKDQELIELAGVGNKVIEFETEQLNKKYPLPDTDEEDYQPELLRAYKVLEDDSEVAVIYVISTRGRNPGVEVAYAINIETKTLSGVLVMNNDETPSFFSALDNNFFKQLSGKELDDPAFGLDTVAGSTYSSKAFETGIKYARELFARDFDFEIPDLPYTINAVTRNFDPTTMVDKPFIVDLVFGADNQAFVGYFDNDFAFIELISGVTPEQGYLDFFQTVLPETDGVDTETFITSYDALNRKIVIESVGFGAKTISVELEFNAEMDSFVSVVVTSDQSYDAEYNSDYTDGAFPYVENQYRDQFLVDGTILDGFTGATITSDALSRIFTLANQVLASIDGGGN